MRFQEEEKDWRLPSLMYADELVLCGESEEDPRAVVGCCVGVCRRRVWKSMQVRARWWC